MRVFTIFLRQKLLLFFTKCKQWLSQRYVAPFKLPLNYTFNLFQLQVFLHLYLILNFSSSLSQVVKIAAALGVFFGYPIQFYIMIRIIWVPMKQSSTAAQKYPITIQVILRFFLVLLTCKFKTFIKTILNKNIKKFSFLHIVGVALLVPKLHLFISLIGAFCSTALAFVFPVFVDFVIRAQRPKGLNTWVYLKNIVILIIAVLGIFTGTYESINEIIKEFNI